MTKVRIPTLLAILFLLHSAGAAIKPFAQTTGEDPDYAALHARLEALNLPLQFTIPSTSSPEARVPKGFDTIDNLIYYRHPNPETRRIRQDCVFISQIAKRKSQSASFKAAS